MKNRDDLLLNNETVLLGDINESQILIIDDEPIILQLIEANLSRYKFNNTTTISSYEKACGYINTLIEKINHIDLIILDVVFPNGNGFELCKKIKTELPTIPVIMISGYEIKQIYEKIVESEADDFLVKPFDGVELAMRVNLHLHKKHYEHNNLISIGIDPKVSESIKAIGMKRNCPYIGETVNNYIIVDSLGWSKTSAVYKVIDKETHKIFAMKLIVFATRESEGLYERFEVERELIAKCNHPNIISFVSRGNWGDTPYLVMEYFESVDLEEYLVSHGKISYKPFCKIAYLLADALNHIHENSITHRDIKLKNILFSPEICDIKIADFGIARHPDFTSMTKTGYVMGTPMYMPPEVFAGEDASASSDIYSYGATLYHLLTGVPPYVADRASELADHHKNTIPSPIKIFRDDISEELDSFIVYECMAKRLQDRPKSMKDVAEIIKKLAR